MNTKSIWELPRANICLICLIFLSGCQEEMQSRPALIFIENHFEMFKKEMIRTKLSSSSGFISLGPLNFQTVGLGKQPYRSPKVYRVSYFRSTWKNAWISAVEMQLFPFFDLPLVLRSYKFQKIIIMIVYAGHVNWGTYLSISGSTLPSTSAFFFKIMFEII